MDDRLRLCRHFATYRIIGSNMDQCVLVLVTNATVRADHLPTILRSAVEGASTEPDCPLPAPTQDTPRVAPSVRNWRNLRVRRPEVMTQLCPSDRPRLIAVQWRDSHRSALAICHRSSERAKRVAKLELRSACQCVDFPAIGNALHFPAPDQPEGQARADGQVLHGSGY